MKGYAAILLFVGLVLAGCERGAERAAGREAERELGAGLEAELVAERLGDEDAAELVEGDGHGGAGGWRIGNVWPGSAKGFECPSLGASTEKLGHLKRALAWLDGIPRSGTRVSHFVRLVLA